MRVALAALALVDVLFLVTLAAEVDARLRRAADNASLFIGLAVVYAATAVAFVVRARSYFAYWRTATLYASAGARALTTPLPLPTSIVDGNRAAAHYSAVVVVVLLVADAPTHHVLLLAAWTVACAANLVYAVVSDDRPALRRAVRELLDERLADATGDPVRATWSAAELGASAARLPPRRAAGDMRGVLDDDDDDWSTVLLSEDTSAALPRRAAPPPTTAAATASSSGASTPSSESDECSTSAAESRESDAASGETEMLFDGTLGSRVLREKYDAALRSR